MAVHLIELSDANIRVCDSNGILLESPGFANIAQNTPLFGEDARNLTRLHPRHSFNQFWSQLSMDPLVNSNDHFRHQADLAYGHLSKISEDCAISDDVIFAVPANYNRNQLSILLGLAGQCPFNTVGLVDLSLLYLSVAGQVKHSLYIDIQLHQTVLTSFVLHNGLLTRDKTVQIPGVGLEALYEIWVSMITDEFIRQSRFDPQHNADTEQFVYNSLKNWITLISVENDTLLEINNKGTVHQAKLNQAYFEQRAKPVFKKIQTEIDSLFQPGMAVFMSASAATLPGVKNYLPEPIVLADDAYLEHAFHNIEQIRREPGAIGLVSSLKHKQTESNNSQAMDSPEISGPTHILIDHHAYILPGDTLLLGGTVQQQSINHIPLDAPAMAEPIIIDCSKANPVISIQQAGVAELNNQPFEGKAEIHLGDKLHLPGSNINISFIRVQ